MAGLLDLVVGDASAVRDADQSGVHCQAPSLESDRDFLPSASAGAEEPEDAVSALPGPLRGGLQSVANQPEP
jgi:hypothetical protein